MSFVVVDVDEKRVIIYILESREVVFLFICPDRVKSKIPWECLFKSVHGDPTTFQLHFEFCKDPILPQWFDMKRVAKVEKTEFIKLMGKSRIRFMNDE